MPRRSSLSSDQGSSPDARLRRRLLAWSPWYLVAFALLLVAGGQAIELRRQYQDAQRLEAERAQARAQRAADILVQRLGAVQLLLSRLQAALQDNPLDALSISQSLARLDPQVEAVLVIDADGLVSASSRDADVGRRAADQSLLRTLAAEDAFDPRLHVLPAASSFGLSMHLIVRARHADSAEMVGGLALLASDEYFLSAVQGAVTPGWRMQVLDAAGQPWLVLPGSEAGDSEDMLGADAELTSPLVGLAQAWRVRVWRAPEWFIDDWTQQARIGLLLWLLVALTALTAAVIATLRSAELRRLRQVHRHLLHGADEGLLGIDRDARIRFANPAFARRCACQPGELIGRELGSCLRPLVDEDVEEPVQEVLAGRLARHEGEAELLLGDGGRVRLTITPSRDRETLSGALLAVSDTQDAQAPTGMQGVAERHYRTLFELSPDGILIVDVDSELPVAFNAVAARQLGYRPEAFAVMRIREHEAQPTPLATIRHIAKVLAEGRDEFETRYRCADGGERDVYVVAQTIEFAGRPALYWIVRDITDRKRAEVRLAEARDAAEQANRARSEFLANMSHEIRTPMTAILGLVYLLQKSSLSEIQRDYSEKIDSAARTLLAILDDLLDYAKLETGRISIDRKPFHPRQVLSDIGVVFQPLAREKGLRLSIDCDDKVPVAALGDAVHLRQILLNLVGNAIKFTEQGQVSVRVGAPQGVIPSEGEAFELSIAVRDTGIGIHQDKLAKIFDAFYQVETSTTRRYGGTGLGLPITYRLVQLMSGEIDVESHPGAGSEFRVNLPMLRSSAPMPGEGQTFRPGDAALLVEDDATASEVLRSMLAAAGWQVEAHADGESALAAMQRRSPSARAVGLVLVDLALPGIDGVETLRRLFPVSNSRPPVLLLSAHGADALNAARETLPELIDDVLAKPVDASALQRAIESASNRCAARRGQSGGGRLAHMHVLLVEDHPVNRHVAREILASEGALVETAVDGHEALARLRQSRVPFDAVLMDIQMPGMDGYTAAREIRGRMGLAELPIIAMTANSSPEDREHSRLAGMNDHLAKPIDFESLVACLLRYARGVVLPQLRAPAASATDSPGELPVLAVDKALTRLAGNRALYAQMARMFGQEQGESARILREALARGERDDAIRAAHTLKGVAATLGAERLSAVAARLERALRKRSDAASLDALASELASALDAAVSELGRFAQGSAQQLAIPVPDDEFDRAAFEDCLDALVLSLVDSEMVAVDHFAELRSLCAESLQAALDPVREALERLDFPAALQACRGVETAVGSFCERGGRHSA